MWICPALKVRRQVGNAGITLQQRHSAMMKNCNISFPSDHLMTTPYSQTLLKAHVGMDTPEGTRRHGHS